MKNLRKVVTALLVLGMLTGCGSGTDKDKKEPVNQTEQETDKGKQEETKEKKDPVKLSDNLMDFQVEIDGEVFTLPFSYEELQSKGWKPATQPSKIKSGIDQNVYLKDVNNRHRSMTAILLNTENEEMDFDLCKVAGFDISDMETEYVDFKLAKGISNGSTKDDVITAYGEPQSENEGSVTYQQGDDGKKYVQLIFDENNLVQLIHIRNL